MSIRIAAAAVLTVASVSASATESAEAKVRAAVAAMAPNTTIESLRPAAMPGVYEVSVGGSVVYVSADGLYLLNGALWKVPGKRNLTEDSQSLRRRALLAGVDDSQRIVFAAAQPKHTVTVFTDLDCGYCRRLHQHVQAFNDAGISVEYLLFPRNGLQSPTYNTAVSVWCAANRQQALTLAKNGEAIEPKVCPNPIERDYELARRLGVGNTPTVIAEDGAVIGGYLTPEQMLSQVELHVTAAVKP